PGARSLGGPVAPRAAHVVPPRRAPGRDRAPDAGAVAAIGEGSLVAALEVALLVRGADHAGQAVQALRAALVLIHLDQRLDRATKPRQRALLVERSGAWVL